MTRRALRITAPAWAALAVAAVPGAPALTACTGTISAPPHDDAATRADRADAAPASDVPGAHDDVPTDAPDDAPVVPPGDAAPPTDGSACVRDPTPARAFHVAPGGSASGDGSAAHPWDLATALAQPAAVHPGDTIWLHGGTYRGTFSSTLRGTSAAPIVVRQYPGERATIDGGDSSGNGIFSVAGAYTWYQGFEVMSSDPTRTTTTTGPWPSGTDIPRGQGVQTVENDTTGAGLRFINMVVHDTRQGFSLWLPATDSETYGCLIYNNGWNAPDRTHGHGVYAQNRAPSTLTVADNVIFGNFNHGMQGYGSDAAYVDDMHVTGNAFFDNGDRHLLVGGGMPARDAVVADNFFYRAPLGGGPSSDFQLGYGGGCGGATVTNNYFASNAWITCTPAAMSGNTFLAALNGVAAASYPMNTFESSRPTANRIDARANRYERGRGRVVVYNWEGLAAVDVDVSSFGLCPGDAYEVRSAADPFGTARTGTYDRRPISIPMSGWSVAAPIGGTPAPPTTPEFGVFLVSRR